jgi:2-polyprenyl-3-methyl-5-hydroxy-6-metoxy-1,4-benzoquinol methylase
MKSETTAPRIRTTPAETCRLCGAQGRLLYRDLRDRSFAAPGIWNFRKCQNEACGLVWLDPLPAEEDISKAYEGYYTHNQPQPGPSLLRNIVWGIWLSYLGTRFGYTQGTGPQWHRLFAPLALLHPGGRAELDSAAMHLPAPGRSARVLDVGCGSGVLLARMQSLGWQVEGVEVDPGGVSAARARGVSVRQGSLEQQRYPNHSFDAIHSAHVLEHVHDPLRLLAECGRVLKPGGTLVIATPNIESWGHRQLGVSWSNLDPPRHLLLFSATTLRRAAQDSGLVVRRLVTTIRSAWVYGVLSHSIQRTGRGEVSKLGNPAALAGGILYQLRQRWAMRSDPSGGDELLLLATKASS